MQWKKSDKEERGIDQRRHLLLDHQSQFNVKMLRNQGGRELSKLTTHSLAGVSEYRMEASAALQLCTAGCYVVQQFQCTVFCIEGCCRLVQPQIWRVRECSSALLGRTSPVQKYKLQAATNTFPF